MSRLNRRSAAHSMGDPGTRDRGRPTEAGHVRVVPPHAVDEQPAQVIVQGGATDIIEELLLAAANGDRGAFAALERRIGGLVRVNVRRILRDASRSDSVTQEFFAEVLRDLANYDPDRESAQSWLLARAHLQAMSGLALTPTAASGTNPPRDLVAGSVDDVSSSAEPVS